MAHLMPRLRASVSGTTSPPATLLTYPSILKMQPALIRLSAARVRTVAASISNANQSARFHTGVVHTSDSFRSPSLENDIAISIYAGVLAFEMEAATVLTISAINGLRAGCIFSIDGYVANVAGGNVVPDVNARNRGIKSAIHSSLDAIVSLAKT